jgi:hypothetical protein
LIPVIRSVAAECGLEGSARRAYSLVRTATADCGDCFERMGRMRKILLSAPGSSRRRPNEPKGTAAPDATFRESCSLISQAAWVRSGAAAAIIFCIPSILPILSR